MTLAYSAYIESLGQDLEAYLAQAEASEALSLDTDGHSSISVPVREEWSRQQKRIYHRINSCLAYWEGHGYKIAWVMLSTAVGGNAEKLSYHHQRLRQKIESELGYRGMEHFVVQTAEGNGVLHVLWAWKARKGERQREFWISQGWLVAEWERIHGAIIVWIRRYGGGRWGRKNVSRYVVSHYCSGQKMVVRCSWSWKRTFGFPLVAVWREFRKLYVGPLSRGGVRAWEAVMRGETVARCDWGVMSLEGFRVYGGAT